MGLTVLFYERNGFDLYADMDEAEQFVFLIARSHQELADIGDWLRAHGRPL